MHQEKRRGLNSQSPPLYSSVYNSSAAQSLHNHPGRDTPQGPAEGSPTAVRMDL